MQLEVTVPTMLRDCVGNRTRVPLQARSLREALRRLVEDYPLLRVHLLDEQQQLRPHVLIYYNDENTAGLRELDVPIQPGDRLTILQAVSGG
ncbi:MAG: MoaD/ThiS family protein [Chloroflexota bacterium]|nr:MoaD/ThiS family protein [Chloroflexota bacterium]